LRCEQQRIGAILSEDRDGSVTDVVRAVAEDAR
jgi:hypothetical protein